MTARSTTVDDIRASLERIRTSVTAMRQALATFEEQRAQFLQTFTLAKPPRPRKPAETQDMLDWG